MDGDRQALRERLFEFEAALLADACEEVVATGWGRVLASPTVPLIWVANQVVLEREGLPVGEVVELAERELGDRGLDHRMVLVRGEADGARLAAELEDGEFAGWAADRFVYMVWGGGEVSAAPVAAREVRLDEIGELRRELFVAEVEPGSPEPEESAVQMFEHWRRVAAVAGDRSFVVPAAGEPAGACCLLRRGGIGQVEDVTVLAAERGRGLGGALVLAALAASREAGDELTMITADADDRPRELYRRLGFEPVGTVTALRRPPPSAPA